MTSPNTISSKDKESHEIGNKEEHSKKQKQDAPTARGNTEPTNVCETLHSEDAVENDLLYESGDACSLHDGDASREKTSQRKLRVALAAAIQGMYMNIY